LVEHVKATILKSIQKNLFLSLFPKLLIVRKTVRQNVKLVI